MDGGDFGRLAYLLLILVAIGGWVIVEYRGRMGFALRSAAAWGLIFVGMAAGYGLWSDISRDGGRVQIIAENGRIEVPRGPDGHFYLTLTVGGVPVEFMADTGASNVVLSGDDARRVGIDPETLVYAGEASTANGTVRTARVALDDVSLGPVTDPQIRAYVTDGAMDLSLLGMDYLGRFRIEIDGDTMVLLPRA